MSLAEIEPREDVNAGSVAAAVAPLMRLMRDEADECDRLGRLTPAVVQSLDATGVFRMRLPERYGGLNLTIAEQLDAVIEVSRGSGSAGWIVWVTNLNYAFALAFPDSLLEEIFAEPWEGPHFAAAAFSPHLMGQARDVDGGYRVKGVWPFASGIAHAKYFLGGIDFADGRERMMAILPAAGGKVLDDWNVVGMKASASNSFLLEEEIFIPAHFALPFSRLFGGLASVDARHGTRSGIVPVGVNQGIAIGLARAALELFLEQAKTKKPFGLPYKTMAEAPMIQSKVGEAYAKILAAEALLRQYAIPGAADAQDINRQLVSYAGRLASEAVETLHVLLGSSGIYDGNPLLRCLRDMIGLNLHPVNRWEFTAENLGRIALGLAPHSMLS